MITNHFSRAPADQRLGVLLAACIGLVAFVWYTGGTIIWPTRIDWLMRGDFSQHYLGWNFFRHAPLLQNPPGKNWNYGEALGSSIVYTDSTPLFAFLFKPFAALLPEPFQYIGLWLALTAILQGVFAYLLLSQFCKERLTVLLATAFFVFAPPLWLRIYLESDALSAHWLILAALYLYFKQRFVGRHWLLLLCGTALIHGYLLAMVLAIWGANLLQRRLKQEVSTLQLGRHVFSAIACLAIVMWFAGYFMLHGGVSTPVGIYSSRLNLYTLVDPMGWWSNILPDHPDRGWQFESASFLGIGVLLLLPITGITWLIARSKRTALDGHRWTLWPLVACAVFLTAVALTNKIGWGDRVIFSYRVPIAILNLLGIFRMTGRLFWPVFYLIYVAAFYGAFKLIGKKILPSLLVALLILQLLDGRNAPLNLRNSMQNFRWQTPLVSAFWQRVPDRYQRIHVIMPLAAGIDVANFPLALFASNHGLSINNGYFARVDTRALQNVQRQTVAQVFSGSYDPHTLYLFQHDGVCNILWEMAKQNADPNDFLGVIDGYRVFAPGARHPGTGIATDLPLEQPAAVRLTPPNYTLGTTLDFRSGGNAAPYLLGGWSSPERWGRWTGFFWAAMWLSVPPQTHGDLTLEITARAYVPREHPRQDLEVSVNGQLVGELNYVAPHELAVTRLRVPAQVVVASHGTLLILLQSADSAAPNALMLSPDTRSLGIDVSEMRLY